MEVPLSRPKLIAYLKSQYIDKKNITKESMYLYATGRNSLADNLLISIISGEFDEVNEG